MSDKPQKFHLSLRVDPDTARRIEDMREDGQPLSRIYNAVLRAGVDALENTGEHAQDNSGELVAALQASVDTLTTQLGVKDAQISALNETVKGLNANLQAAQSLHLMTTQHKPIEAAEWPTAAQEKPQETRQATEWVNTPEEPAQPAQPTPSYPTQRNRGGLFGAVRSIFTGR